MFQFYLQMYNNVIIRLIYIIVNKNLFLTILFIFRKTLKKIFI